jgi:N-acetylmuramoyl-L-alanine amidase
MWSPDNAIPRTCRSGKVFSRITLLWCLLLMVPGGAMAGPGPEVVRIRHFSAPDHTRVVLDLSGPGSFEIVRVANPDRIAVNVFGATFAASGSIAVGDGLVKGIRRNAGTSRAQVVLDLTARSEFRSFSLPADQGRPHRVVVDILRNGRPAAKPAAAKAPGSRSVRKADSRPPEPALKPAPRPFRVIIDPGHGGLDPGATRGKVREKDVVLDISRELARLINAIPGYRAELTRQNDYGLELWQRVDFARRKEGDLFLSIHCNTHPRKNVSGMEVYFLSMRGATDREAKELADKENAAQLVGLDPGERPDDLVVDILMDLQMSRVMHESSRLAGHLLTAADEGGVVQGRKVKQAGFHVLKSLAMPSALVEVAYLSNRDDRRILQDKGSRQKIAASLLQGILQWRKDGQALARLQGEKPDTWTRRYTVAKGDNLWRLARRHGTTVTEISRRNNLDSGAILVGQRLTLPQESPQP